MLRIPWTARITLRKYEPIRYTSTSLCTDPGRETDVFRSRDSRVWIRANDKVLEGRWVMGKEMGDG